jgi:hypothetical protein
MLLNGAIQRWDNRQIYPRTSTVSVLVTMPEMPVLIQQITG